MAIEEIYQREFDELSPALSAIVMAISEEFSWHADTARNIYRLCSYFLEKTNIDWGFVILGWDPRGAFRAIEVEASIEDQDEVIESRNNWPLGYISYRMEEAAS